MTRLSMLLAVVALFSSACGLKRVPGNVLDKLPYEAKIELLEAENDLALAVDRLDEAKNEVTRTRNQIRRAKDRQDAAKSEVGQAQDDTSREVAQLAVTEAEKRVEWLRASQRINGKEEDLAYQNLDCAYARYELARLNAARKAKLEGSEELDPEVFQGQVTSCEEEYAELKEKLKESNAEAEQFRADWDEARAALAKKTFDARASPFVE
jgi:peptidoglycan hydrolase CwlO-like protein